MMPLATLNKMPADLVICVGTPLEGAQLRENLPPAIPLLITGVGAVNAAIALTRFLERQGALAVVVCGIGGAYPGSGLQVGSSVAWASSECYGDLGAASPTGFLDMAALGFPVIGGPEPAYNTLPIPLRPRGMAGVPFVTVNTCTGDDVSARALAARTGGAVESMEGAAIAHVARVYGIPAGEVRGISNPVGTRDRSAWRVREAALAAQQELLRALRGGELLLQA